jgi:signal transduction histidine kinase
MVFQDTGCGIPADRLNQIFERFVSSSNQGTGLGLSICHELVKQMGGKIKIKSNEAQGTIVWVTIPCKCTEIVRK